MSNDDEGFGTTVHVCSGSDGSDSEEDTTSSTSSTHSPARRILPGPNDDGMCDRKREEYQEELKRCQDRAHTDGNFGSLGLSTETELIEPIAHLHHLTILTLSHNAISELPEKLFDDLPSLVKLDLSNNQLAKLPPEVLTLRCLKQLLLDHNNLKELPTSFESDSRFSLPQLETVGLEWNALEFFPTQLLEIAPKLTGLYLSENSEMGGLPNAASFAGRDQMVLLKVDNRPELIQHFDRLVTGTNGAGSVRGSFTVDWNKIYPDKVMDFVFLGSVRTAQCTDVYRDLDIRYVLTAGRDLKVVITQGMEHRELPVDDLPTENIRPFFVRAFEFIDRAITSRKGILIHCFAGLSRSVTIMVAYLMQRGSLTRDAALRVVRRARPHAEPNEGFMLHLLHFERQLVSEGVVLSDETRDFFTDPIRL